MAWGGNKGKFLVMRRGGEEAEEEEVVSERGKS